MEMPDDMLPSLEEMVKRSDHILVLEALGKRKEYYTKTFPKETHFEKRGDSIYTEDIYSYKVIKIIKSDSIKINEVIWIWRSPAYGESIMQLEHESGILESPFQSMYKPKNTKKKNEKHEIYFLRNIESPKQKNTYDNFEYGVEAIATESEIIKLLKK